MSQGHILGLVVCALGIYLSFIPYGIFQESIYSYSSPSGQRFDSTLTLLLVQVIGHTVVSGGISYALRENPQTLPMKEAWMPGFTFVSAMLFSNLALEYVSYPTQALAKSSKMIPVMIGGLFFGSERYSLLQYMQVVCVTIGITVFQWKSPKTTRENDFFGLALLILSLILDGLTGPKQKLITAKRRCTSFQLMFACNAWAMLLLGTLLFSPLGEGLGGVEFITASENSELFRYVILFSACSALGSSMIFFTLKKFG